jgi:hypothetical protein
MGAENLGTALYALCRFVKPGNVLEVGGGYTSVFILQALAVGLSLPGGVRFVTWTLLADIS